MSYSSANLNKYTTTNSVYRWHIETFHKHLVALGLSTRPLTILDAGCGEGHLSSAFHNAAPNIQIVGVDASSEAIEFANDSFSGVGHFSTADIFDLPFDDDSFDLTVCSQVLEHLDDPDKAIAELKRVSARHVLISVPLEPYFKFFNDISRFVGISPDPGHVQFWTKTSFPRFIDEHFEKSHVSSVHYYQSALCYL